MRRKGVQRFGMFKWGHSMTFTDLQGDEHNYPGPFFQTLLSISLAPNCSDMKLATACTVPVGQSIGIFTNMGFPIG
jgi:hypothetical protein